jgi:c-di-GMP-related signal transduction protein
MKKQDKISDLIIEINETLDTFDEAREEGMDFEQGYDFAGEMYGQLIDVLQVLKKLQETEDK